MYFDSGNIDLGLEQVIKSLYSLIERRGDDMSAREYGQVFEALQVLESIQGFLLPDHAMQLVRMLERFLAQLLIGTAP